MGTDQSAPSSLQQRSEVSGHAGRVAVRGYRPDKERPRSAPGPAEAPGPSEVTLSLSHSPHKQTRLSETSVTQRGVNSASQQPAGENSAYETGFIISEFIFSPSSQSSAVFTLHAAQTADSFTSPSDVEQAQ